jgi:two-component system sensor kinase FixL
MSDTPAGPVARFAPVARSGPAPARRSLSLRGRLVLLVIGSIVPFMAFILGFQYVEYRNDVADTGRQTLALARSMAMLVDGELQSRIAVLQALALSTPPPQDGDVEAFRPLAETVVAQQFPGAAILLIRPDGQQLMNTRLPQGAPLPARRNLESMERMLATGRPAVSDLFIGAVAQQPVIAIDVPVRRPDGSIAYALTLNPRLEIFAEIIRNQRLPASWVIGVFDRNGVAVARVPDGGFVGHEASASILGPLRTEREGVVESTSLEGIPVLTMFSHEDRFGWGIAIGVPRAELTAPAFAAANQTLAVGAVLLAASLAFALYAARRIAGPIGTLRRIAADHDASSEPRPTGLWEVDEVARALREAEAARRRSHEAELVLRDGIESIPEGFAIYDDEDRLVMRNQAYRDLFPDGTDRTPPGTRYEDALRAGLAEGRYAVAAGAEEAWIAERMREHRDPRGAFEQRLQDGRWVLVTKRRLSNGWISSLRVDVTALKEAELRVRERELRLGSILDTISDGIVVIDEAGLIQLFSPAAERLFGHRRDEAVGRNIAMMMPSPNHEEHDAYLARYLATGERRIIGIGRVVVGRRKDGSDFPMELSVGEFQFGGRRFFTGFVRDLTQRQEAEKRLQDLQAELLHVSRLSTMGQMVAALAHELNQPLSAIISYLQGLRRIIDHDGTGGAARITDVIDRVVAQANRAGGVIRRLREFVAKGETDPSLEDLNTVVEEAVTLAIVGARERGIRLSVRLDTAVAPVLVDRVQLQQVVLNLVRNAVEAMERSERRDLDVATRRTEDGQGVEIEVTDSGSGIAPAIAERLFQPFNTDKATGMGIGLSICRGIVEAHGGRIAARANTPRGTVFTVTLPTTEQLGQP